ncbi:MAG TPA: tRNA (adenosine(37)-N6)-threonylcarbamoyltransferase complex ATPase subunit type 1 TsaE [Dehalococcoidia bacterium]|nr:tRNA (adenosine(37)-N6)-threonylcarbamoyltransferase complex ATPase subunit type 1 TsaE [Dehalococcoidia bacterium]
MIETSSPEETRALGETLGRATEAGDVILLSGELGAGKTVFVQGIARGLGFEGPVSSKSFVLMGEYPGRLTLYHADLYRLDSPEQVEDLALMEISADGVLVVEWPERGDWALPEDNLLLRFEVIDETTRRMRAEPTGARAKALAGALR